MEKELALLPLIKQRDLSFNAFLLYNSPQLYRLYRSLVRMLS